MPKNQIVLSEPSAAIVADVTARVDKLHSLSRAAARDAIIYWAAIGAHLLRLDEITPNARRGISKIPTDGILEAPGKSAIKRAAFPHISNGTLYNYEAFARRVLEKFPGMREALLNAEALTVDERDALMGKLGTIPKGRDVTLCLRDSGLIEDATPAGGFRPNAKALRRWLEKAHPEHAATPWADLPKAIQREYRAALNDDLADRYDRQAPAEVLAARQRAAVVRWRPVLAFLEREIGRSHDAEGKAVPAFWPHLLLADAPAGDPDIQTLHDLLGELRTLTGEHLRNRQ